MAVPRNSARGTRGCPGGARAGKTHRELFSEFYEDLLRAPLAAALAADPAPPRSVALFQRMMHDIMSGGQTRDSLEQVRPTLQCFACA